MYELFVKYPGESIWRFVAVALSKAAEAHKVRELEALGIETAWIDLREQDYQH